MSAELFRADIKAIFEPVIAKIKDLVKEQVNEVRIKLLTSNRSNENSVVKVRYSDFLLSFLTRNRLSSSSVDLVEAHTSVGVSEMLIRAFKCCNHAMREFVLQIVVQTSLTKSQAGRQ